jgi:hypothetical protein
MINPRLSQRSVNTCLEEEMKIIHALQMKVRRRIKLLSLLLFVLPFFKKTWTPKQAAKKIDDYSGKVAAYASSGVGDKSDVGFTDDACMGKYNMHNSWNNGRNYRSRPRSPARVDTRFSQELPFS